MVQGRELCAEVLARQFRAARKRRKDDSGLAARIVVCQRVGSCALLTGLQEVDYFAHGVSTIIRGVVSCRRTPRLRPRSGVGGGGGGRRHRKAAPNFPVNGPQRGPPTDVSRGVSLASAPPTFRARAPPLRARRQFRAPARSQERLRIRNSGSAPWSRRHHHTLRIPWDAQAPGRSRASRGPASRSLPPTGTLCVRTSCLEPPRSER